MLKQAMIGTLAALIVASGSATKQPSNTQTTTSTTISTNTSAQAITEAQAKEIALEHANLSEADVISIYVKQDYEDGRLVYEVEFYHSTAEYDYEIDAQSGQILSYDYDAEQFGENTKASTGIKSSTTDIGIDSASQIALQKVPGATSEHLRSIHLDYDDGIAIYEGKIIYGELEYEFEISAATGSILDWDVESIYD